MGSCIAIYDKIASQTLTFVSELQNQPQYVHLNLRWGGRVVEGARLESVYMGNYIEGSNPFLTEVYKIRK